MTSISLESAIRTCKVDVSYANKVASDRFLNPENMVCPIWNGLDTQGRSVCPDSFQTKRAGCNSAQDRVVVENNQRPQYMEYISLSSNGIGGEMYANQRSQDYDEMNGITGSFGQQLTANAASRCGVNAYKNAMAQQSKARRENQARGEGYNANEYRASAGF